MKTRAHLSPSSDEAPVPPGCLSTEYPALRVLFSFQRTLLTTGNFSADSQPDDMVREGDLWVQEGDVRGAGAQLHRQE